MKPKKVKNKFYLIILSLYLVNQLNVVAANDNNYSEFNLQEDWQSCIWDPSKAKRLCGGFYKEPNYHSDPMMQDSKKDALIIKSDQTKFISKGWSSFTGNVLVTKKDQRLYSNKLLVAQNAQGKINALEVPGMVKLTEPGLRIIGKNLKVCIDNNYKLIKDANYRIYEKHATGDSEQIEIFSDQLLKMPNATYSTCHPDDQTWQIKAKKVHLDKSTGIGKLWDAKLYLYNVPIFYSPYISLPIDNKRHSGFLSPNIDNSSNHGLTLGIPWYWNIATNYDYTISPYYMSKRGVKFNNNFRYLTKKSLGILEFDFLFNDKTYKKFITEKLNNINYANNLKYLKLKKHKLRYGIWYKNITNLNPNLSLYLQYNRVSDSNYLIDFGKDLGQTSFNDLSKINNSNKISQPMYNNYFGIEDVIHSSSLHLEQSFRLENINQYGTLNFNISKYQTLYPWIILDIEQQFQKLPEINWESNYIKLANNYYFKYNLSYSNFRLSNLKNLTNRSVAQRIHFRPILEYPIIATYGYFKPRVKLDILSYNNLKYSRVHASSDQSTDKSRIIPIFDLKSGLYFDKMTKSNWRQIIEPQIYYLYVPKINQERYPIFDSKFIEYSYRQMFLDNRYSGSDRIADANQVTLGLKTTLRNPIGDEKMALSIARTRYLRKLTPYLAERLEFGKWSPMAISLDYRVAEKWTLGSDLILEKLNKVRNNSLNLQYRAAEERILNFGYQYSRFNLIANHQVQTSMVWALKDQLNLLAKIDYDLNKTRVTYSLLGTELNSCCLSLRLAMSRSLLTNDLTGKSKYNNKFLAQIIFKGFTGLGSLEDNSLSEKISGYRFLNQF